MADIKDKLVQAVNEFKKSLDGQTIPIHGKSYATVALRVAVARRVLGTSLDIVTKIIHIDADKVVMQADIYVDGKHVSTGHSEENRKASRINQTSALENSETSAVGRAAAFAGLTNDNIASSNEVSNAIVASDTKLTTALAELDKVSHLGAYKSWLTTNQKLMQDVKASNAHAWQEFLEKFNQIKNKLETNGVIQ